MINDNTQKSLFPELEYSTKSNIKSRSGTFSDNMKLPIHRWFRYSAGFSAQWAETEMETRKKNGTLSVLDPFAGSGTTLLAASSDQVRSVGFESHPFVYRIAKAKLNWDVDTLELKKRAEDLVAYAKTLKDYDLTTESPLLTKCFEPQALRSLESLKRSFLYKCEKEDKISELLWLAITSILRVCSSVGTAQWQYLLPNKKKAKTIEPVLAFEVKIAQIIEDIQYAKRNNWTSTSEIVMTDARFPTHSSNELFDLVITSPPYPNNYDYADATRLEMTFWGEVKGWGDLHSAARQFLIRSCSQHSAKEKLTLDTLLNDEILNPILPELEKACRELEEVRKTKGGKKTYHTMAAAYFSDLGYVMKSLRSCCKEGSEMCFVIGDSAPYGVYLDVENWLGALALNAGFKSYSFEKLRDRNIKWKNRKHRVPLKEGRLWIKG